MGCDWIHFGGCSVGYGIILKSFFEKTCYEFDLYRDTYDDEEYEEEEEQEEEESEDEEEENEEESEGDEMIVDTNVIAVEDEVLNENKDKEDSIKADNGKKLLFSIRREWDKYLNEFHPLIDRNDLPGWRIICPTFLAQYESRGIGKTCYLIWGHALELNKLSVQKFDDYENWSSMKYKFPENGSTIIVDFLSRFYHLKCMKNASIGENNFTSSKEKISKMITSGIYGSTGTNAFLSINENYTLKN